MPTAFDLAGQDYEEARLWGTGGRKEIPKTDDPAALLARLLWMIMLESARINLELSVREIERHGGEVPGVCRETTRDLVKAGEALKGSLSRDSKALWEEYGRILEWLDGKPNVVNYQERAYAAIKDEMDRMRKTKASMTQVVSDGR